MKVSIGSDHRGLEPRKVIADAIQSLELEVVDLGSFTEESCDYPDIAEQVSRNVAEGSSERGILICGTGIGMSIAANKVAGVRAALCTSVEAAKLSRQHNNANVLCLASNDYDSDQLKQVVSAWLTTEFEGGRHARRVEKIKDLESCDPCSQNKQSETDD